MGRERSLVFAVSAVVGGAQLAWVFPKAPVHECWVGGYHSCNDVKLLRLCAAWRFVCRFGCVFVVLHIPHIHSHILFFLPASGFLVLSIECQVPAIPWHGEAGVPNHNAVAPLKDEEVIWVFLVTRRSNDHNSNLLAIILFGGRRYRSS